MSESQTAPIADSIGRRSFLKAGTLGAAAAAVGSRNAAGGQIHDPVPRFGPPPFAFEETGLDEIARRLRRPAVFEMSTFTHHLWCIRSRYVAWDHPNRSYKRFVDLHCRGAPTPGKSLRRS